MSRFHIAKSLQNIVFRQSFSTNRIQMNQQYHFDTFKFVERLEKANFTRQQSESIMKALRKVIGESMTELTKPMVTKAEQEKVLCLFKGNVNSRLCHELTQYDIQHNHQAIYMYKVDFAHLKSEIQLLEKNDFSIMKAENERLQAQVEKLRQRLKEEIVRAQANVRLDLNLEKGRVRDEASGQEIKMKETDTRIESEIAGLRTQMEAIKFQILQYMVGTMTGAGALFLAYLRIYFASTHFKMAKLPQSSKNTTLQSYKKHTLYDIYEEVDEDEEEEYNDYAMNSNQSYFTNKRYSTSSSYSIGDHLETIYEVEEEQQ
ncbi:hypothetical protein PS6_007232 [Mucor atramentarius]